MVGNITIDHVLQYLHLSPEHQWNKFELESIEYYDINLLDLLYDEYLPHECEHIVAEVSTEDSDGIHKNLNFDIYRTVRHIIIQPTLTFRIEGLEFLGTKCNFDNLQLLKNSLKLYTQLSLDVEILNAFVNGSLHNMWKIKPV